MLNDGNYDAVIVGGGFYGCSIAIYLAREKGMKRILLVEKESSLLSRASYSNQARVHNGYHYPRSFTTAYRSRVNLPRFVVDWPQAVKTDFLKVYAIARNNSKVTARQFERFCKEIEAELSPAPKNIKGLFNSQLIEEVYSVKEYAFDSRKLAQWAFQELAENLVDIKLACNVEFVRRSENGLITLGLQDLTSVSSRYVFNCTYSGLNQVGGQFEGTSTSLKHEITEMALMKMPSELEDLGVTVMDGPFFSFMPFPAKTGLHTLSHVRYTPHCNWLDNKGINPYMKLDAYDAISRVDRMRRDVSRFMPSISLGEYSGSLFEVKTVLMKNEGDDGRPILFEESNSIPRFYSVLGGKIDNIYDALEKIDNLELVVSDRIYA